MDMQSLIEKSHIGHWMKRSGKTFDDIDKYEKYEYEQMIKLLKITMKQFDMVNSSTKTPGYIHRQQEREMGQNPCDTWPPITLVKKINIVLCPNCWIRL